MEWLDANVFRNISRYLDPGSILNFRLVNKLARKSVIPPHKNEIIKNMFMGELITNPKFRARYRHPPPTEIISGCRWICAGIDSAIYQDENMCYILYNRKTGYKRVVYTHDEYKESVVHNIYFGGQFYVLQLSHPRYVTILCTEDGTKSLMNGYVFPIGRYIIYDFMHSIKIGQIDETQSIPLRGGVDLLVPIQIGKLSFMQGILSAYLEEEKVYIVFLDSKFRLLGFKFAYV